MEHYLTDNLISGVIYADCLPLSCQQLAAPLPEAALVRLGQENDEILRALFVLSETPRESFNDAADPQQLHFKLNLILDLVSRLYLQSVILPEVVSFRLTGRAIEWRTAEALPVGQAVQLTLYLSDKYPRPLVLAGVVAAVTPLEESHFTVIVTLAPLTESSQDQLDKFIFRQHRRVVAYRKQVENS
ncbi:MAG: hypothetical protein FD130_1822 [Halothiobacillaceae bacterium]|nr:MAG: hypothetical protein FD130_1822 [Halothiobacillaceae bacterium]